MERSLRVLLIEDSEDDAELVWRVLRRGGMQFTTERVATGEGLREALDRGSWDVILTDYALPHFGGKAALDLVRERGLDIPFIIVSGSLGENVAVEMMKAGAHDFFAKGNLTRLVVAIEREVRETEVRRLRTAERARAEEERSRLINELQQAVRVRDTFLDLAAHELRSPLTAAQLKLDFLLRAAASRAGDKWDEWFKPNLEFIGRQHWRLAALVDNFLAVARTTSGEREVGQGPVDLAHEVRESLRQLDDELKASGSAVTLRAGDRVVGDWDRPRIRTAARNLLANAIKYGEGKPIDVEVAVDGTHARLVVTDNGVGVSPEAQGRIFNQFEHTVPAYHHTGFGLGLWVTRRIVEAHGGTISLTSELGAGASFTMTLPVRPSA